MTDAELDALGKRVRLWQTEPMRCYADNERNPDPTHPGVMLKEDFLEPTGIKQSRLAEHIGVPLQRINELVNGKRGVTPDTAWRLAAAFGTSPEYWMNLQANYDLARERPAELPRRIDEAQRFESAVLNLLVEVRHWRKVIRHGFGQASVDDHLKYIHEKLK